MVTFDWSQRLKMKKAANRITCLPPAECCLPTTAYFRATRFVAIGMT